jgi:multidrug efflux pump subunit AcrA (membrane-fusion protein)
MERTVITAPFNSFVKEEYIDVGQLVSPQSRIATLVGTDQFWVQVALPVERLSWITVPRNEQTEGSRAVVLQSTGSGIDISRMGRVTRLIGELDPVGRMARLLVSVDDPLGLFNNRKKKDLPLILGAYVNVELEGTMLRNIFAVPRLAIHNLDRVWLLDMDNCLAMKKVSIVWRNEDTVFISDGLKSGDRVITSSLPTPIPGMELNQVEAKN